ncbi:hypothetical protein COCC4DRAFT_65558 [Bipolaris maydis ATCC 48331]|uniref:Uncharacterized protein n=2 Tax=Cochliobolus heterostrophus TaxID=5016 RepID=M2UGV4_COCH5|nr:uncharacterized protein COCC4DRAFT_65558 [Bipolaris maydis ATCC 48331]EMD87202.1 hypothetical protein COCHEDRAFT_1112966 [Bipolaris maydis C5]ENI00403.1 hypothetical protein COCC4DRAFT_65558 [Bipolaris maydis ATCC 48331]KAJ5056294.1 hypothetical protein J3E74DRAFT_410990 [Bipolaris maydis]
MKFSAIFMIALASIAAASDRNAMPKSCDDCKKFFDACMRSCYFGGNTCPTTCGIDTCRASSVCKEHCDYKKC